MRMIKNYFKKVVAEKAGLTTYAMGLLQAKAYRVLKNQTTEALKDFGISTIEWALLGLLYDNKEGLSFIMLATLLGVEAPFVTAMVHSLEKNNLVMRKSDKNDKRAKIVSLTAAGKNNIPKIEERVRQSSKFLLEHLSMSDILAYKKVLKTIIQNAEWNAENMKHG